MVSFKPTKRKIILFSDSNVAKQEFFSSSKSVFCKMLILLSLGNNRIFKYFEKFKMKVRKDKVCVQIFV